jgi:uncharacterized protein YbcI
VAEFLRVFRHVGFFCFSAFNVSGSRKEYHVEKLGPSVTERIGRAAIACQQQRTGHMPKSAAVILNEDTLVITLHDALSPAERALAKTPEGAAQVQEFHRQLFQTSAEALRHEISRITQVDVCEATAELATETAAVAHVFASGAMVQVFLLAHAVQAGSWSGAGST